LNNGIAYDHLQQDAVIQTFISKNTLSLLSPVILGNVILRPLLGFDAEINALTSELYPGNEQNQFPAVIADSLKNDLKRSYYQVQAGFKVDYKIHKFILNVSLPFSYNRYELNNKLYLENNESRSRFQFDPFVNMQYLLSPKITIGAGASTYNSINGINELYSGYLLQSYRYLNHYNSRLAGFSGHSISAKADYKDIIRMFFASINLAHHYNKNSVTYSQQFEDYLSVSSFVPQSNVSNSILVTGKASKAFDRMRLTTDASVAYVKHTSQQFRQEQLVDYRNDQYSASIRLSAIPVSFIILSYMGVGQGSKSIIASETAFPSIRSLSQTLNVDCKFFNNVMLGAKLEQYTNSIIRNGKSLYFADILLTYSWKQMRFELSWTNVFDTKNYTQAYYDNLNTYASIYRIRPSEVVLKVKLKLK
jgi:hypothetical protein